MSMQLSHEGPHSVERYALPELARRWAAETSAGYAAVLNRLAGAIVVGALTVSPSDDEVLVFFADKAKGTDKDSGKDSDKDSAEDLGRETDKGGALTAVFLPEIRRRVSLVGGHLQPFSQIDTKESIEWMKKLVADVTDTHVGENSLLHRLILIRRKDFQKWLEDKGSPLPRFWFPETSSPARSAGHRERRSAQTTERHQRWQARAQELRATDPAKTTRAVAAEICGDPVLNPGGKFSQDTIRKQIARRPRAGRNS